MIRWVAYTAVGVLLAALGSVAVRHWRERPPAPPAALRAAWLPPDAVTLGAGADFPFGVAMAPGGRQLAYPASRGGAIDLWIHDLSTNQARALPATSGAVAPFWSPDGKRIGFFAGGKLRAIDLGSGTTSDLADAPDPRGASWNVRGDIVFAPRSGGGLQLRAADGSVRALTTLDGSQGESSHRWPAFLDDGRHVVYLVRASTNMRSGLWIASIDATSPPRRLTGTSAQAIVAGSMLIYAADEALMAQPIETATGALVGRAELVGLPVGRGPLDQLLAAASPDVLVYGAPGTALRQLQWVDRRGAPLGRLGDPEDAWDVRIAPDGRRVAFTGSDPQLRTLDVWIHDGKQPVPLRLSPSTNADYDGAWSPDGAQVAWVAANRQVALRGAGAVLPERVVATFDPPARVWDWAKAGAGGPEWIVAGRSTAASGEDLWLVPVRGTGDPRPYTTAPFNQTHAAVSPDGRWIAYASDESGHEDIYVDTFPSPGARIRVTTAGGTEPRWRRDGGELYFRRGGELHAVAVAPAAGTMTMQASTRLFDAGAGLRAYDASADGRRFLLNLPASSAAPAAATLVFQWSRTGHRDTETQR